MHGPSHSALFPSSRCFLPCVHRKNDPFIYVGLWISANAAAYCGLRLIMVLAGADGNIECNNCMSCEGSTSSSGSGDCRMSKAGPVPIGCVCGDPASDKELPCVYDKEGCHFDLACLVLSGVYLALAGIALGLAAAALGIYIVGIILIACCDD